MEIIVVGAGIAGLASAIALAKTGRAVRILEASPEIHDQGAGLQLGPNGVRALESLGVWSSLDQHTFAPKALRIMDALTGETLRRFGFEPFVRRFGAPYRVAHRRDLLDALLTAARALDGIEIVTGHEVSALAWDKHSPRLTLADGKQFSAAAVIGADGVRSAVRRSLLSDGPPLKHDQAIYRALIPRTAAPALPSDVVLWLYPGGHVVHYPVSGGRDVNIVAIIESCRSDGVGIASCSPHEVAACFPEMSPDLRYILGLPHAWSRWTAADRLPAKVWGCGAVTLVGDAAHPMLPYLAQGAVAALEDAVALGDCVACASDLASAFREYESRRRPRTSRLQKRSRAQARLYHWRGWKGALRNRLLQLVPEEYFFSRIAWIYV
jgi:salicylate hydroxylase